jgi:hypothetical protein
LEAKKIEETDEKINQSVNELDEIFKFIVTDFSDLIIESAGEAVNNILNLSSSFIDKKAQQALKDFRGLYFFNKEIADESVAINKSVDDIMEDLQAKMAAGEEVDYVENSNGDSSDISQNRMALSGLQKQLEQIISLDQNIKDKLLPVLSSMQFEDMIRQRLEHVRDGWNEIIANQSKEVDEFKAVLEKIGDSLTSSSEREAYYPKLLNKEAPKGIEDQQSLEDILF